MQTPSINISGRIVVMKHLNQIASVLVATCLIAACAREPVSQRQVEGPKARVRIDNGLPIALYPATSCFNRKGSMPTKPYTSAATYTENWGQCALSSVSVVLRGRPIFAGPTRRLSWASMAERKRSEPSAY